MMKKRLWSRWILALAVVWPCMAAAHDRVREKENFDFDWKFILNADDRANAGMQVSEAGRFWSRFSSQSHNCIP